MKLTRIYFQQLQQILCLFQMLINYKKTYLQRMKTSDFTLFGVFNFCKMQDIQLNILIILNSLLSEYQNQTIGI